MNKLYIQPIAIALTLAGCAAPDQREIQSQYYYQQQLEYAGKQRRATSSSVGLPVKSLLEEEPQVIVVPSETTSPGANIYRAPGYVEPAYTPPGPKVRRTTNCRPGFGCTETHWR